MREPFEIQIANPFTGAPIRSVAIGSGAIATSGIGSRIWRTTDGRLAHHLLDPSTGEPAWTGVVQATALAPSTLLAETIAKAALLSGPEPARRLLARRGGAVVLDDGSTELLGPLALEPLEVAA
jgi:thiamine biosynthesis lipoprotein